MGEVAEKHRHLGGWRLFLDRLIATGGNPRRLEWFGRKVHSQSDEDGIIAEIFHRIGTTNRMFVEFGAEGMENNTHYLLESGWRGLWIEGRPEYASNLKLWFHDDVRDGRAKVVEAYVTRHNINDLIAGAGITGEIDFLSIDIDSIDYYVFEAIEIIQPRVVCLEHNHDKHARPPIDWVMPYDEAYRWDPSGHNADYGASIVALTRLARRKGYELVGCGLYSANGFYVRRDCIGTRFSTPFEPARFFNDLNYEKILAFPRYGRRSRWSLSRS